MLAIGKATQDVFLQGAIFEGKVENGTVFEHLPLGAKLSVDEVTFTTGGNALNAATTFARQGLHSHFMGLVGQEPSGEAVMRTLDDEGIDTRYVRQSAKYRTSYSTVLLAPSGERTILTWHGTKLRSDGADLDLKAIAEADWLYVSSVDSMALLHHIVTIAARSNTKVAINPSGRELQEIQKLRPILDDVHILLANKEEMAMIVEGKTSEELIRHAANVAPVAVMSDGPRGVWTTDGKKLVHAGMYEDVKVVDRLGAGDAFGSGFVAVYARAQSLEEAVVFASANATSVVTKVGAIAGILHHGTRLHDMPMQVSEF